MSKKLESSIKKIFAPIQAVAIIKGNNLLDEIDLKFPFDGNQIQSLFRKLNTAQNIENEESIKIRENIRKFSSILIAILIYYRPEEIPRLSTMTIKVSDLKPIIHEILGIKLLQDWFKNTLSEDENPIEYLDKSGVKSMYMALKDLKRSSYLMYFKKKKGIEGFKNHVSRVQKLFLNNVCAKVYLTRIMENNTILKEQKLFMNENGSSYNLRRVVLYFMLSLSGYEPKDFVYYKYDDLSSFCDEISELGYPVWEKKMLGMLKDSLNINFSNIDTIKALFADLQKGDRLLWLIKLVNIDPEDNQDLLEFLDLIHKVIEQLSNPTRYQYLAKSLEGNMTPLKNDWKYHYRKFFENVNIFFRELRHDRLLEFVNKHNFLMFFMDKYNLIRINFASNWKMGMVIKSFARKEVFVEYQAFVDFFVDMDANTFAKLLLDGDERVTRTFTAIGVNSPMWKLGNKESLFHHHSQNPDSSLRYLFETLFNYTRVRSEYLLDIFVRIESEIEQIMDLSLLQTATSAQMIYPFWLDKIPNCVNNFTEGQSWEKYHKKFLPIFMIALERRYRAKLMNQQFK